jgi:hypothetical protein
MGKANEGIFAKLKKLKNLKKEGKKDASYSNVPIDHSDVDAIKEIDDKGKEELNILMKKLNLKMKQD